MDISFNWHGDVQGNAYYAVVCDLLEKWDEGDSEIPPGPKMALNILHGAHDEDWDDDAIRLAQHYMESFTATVEAEPSGNLMVDTKAGEIGPYGVNPKPAAEAEDSSQ